jgi:hypothetical protein
MNVDLKEYTMMMMTEFSSLMMWTRGETGQRDTEIWFIKKASNLLTE